MKNLALMIFGPSLVLAACVAFLVAIFLAPAVIIFLAAFPFYMIPMLFGWVSSEIVVDGQIILTLTQDEILISLGAWAVVMFLFSKSMASAALSEAKQRESERGKTYGPYGAMRIGGPL